MQGVGQNDMIDPYRDSLQQAKLPLAGSPVATYPRTGIKEAMMTQFIASPTYVHSDVVKGYRSR